jgi:predicted DNA-binding transcriptional regulator AlpA
MSKPADAFQQTAPVVPIEILTPQQLAERLQVKPSWIYEQTRNRSGVRNPDPLPHIKMGLYLRFDWRDVLAWLERQKKCGAYQTRAVLTSAPFGLHTLRGLTAPPFAQLWPTVKRCFLLACKGQILHNEGDNHADSGPEPCTATSHVPRHAEI